jgi:2EXR family
MSFDLLLLPWELRQEIWKLVVPAPCEREIKACSCVAEARTWWDALETEIREDYGVSSNLAIAEPVSRTQPALALVNHQVRNEVLPLLRERLDFHFCNPKCLRLFGQRLTPGQAGKIGCLIVWWLYCVVLQPIQQDLVKMRKELCIDPLEKLLGEYFYSVDFQDFILVGGRGRAIFHRLRISVDGRQNTGIR